MNRITCNSPIQLMGEGGPCLYYENIAAYMNTKQKGFFANRDLYRKLTSEGGRVVPESGVTSSNERIYVALHMIQSKYSGMKITIEYLYRQCGIEISERITYSLNIYCKELKRKRRKLVQYIGLNVYKGNKPTSFKVYIFLSKETI